MSDDHESSPPRVMRYTQQTMPFGVSLADYVQSAIECCRMYESLAIKHDPENGYWLAFSGGKDSEVLKAIADAAGVRYKLHYNVTTIDPPELVRFIRRNHPDVVFEKPERSFFHVLAEELGYPVRNRRWCCRVFKERGGAGRVRLTGVRHAESPRRKALWKQFQRWDETRSGGNSGEVGYVVNPIVQWPNAAVWQFIRENGLPYCELYDEGRKRLGCIGCPMAGAKGVRRDFARWPGIAAGWRRAFHRLWERRAGEVMTRGKRRGKPWPGLPGITSADELFEWWCSGRAAPSEDGEQQCLLGMW